VSYLLDTNVISEPFRAEPEARVVKWLNETPAALQHLSALTLGELRRGLETMQAGRRREAVRVWLEFEVPVWFEERLLPVTVEIADRWGRLQATANRTLPIVDSLLAATALRHGLAVVTRNRKDFEGLGVEIVNPWELE
jgi:predicted nucleic acid-binding protein